jgi:NAD(P)-dependent dehydrogenase (short-subunit alcohol dehydrogenase family)
MTAATLDGNRVLVVGASAGIGRAFAIGAVRDGAKVVLSARRADRLEEVVDEAGGGFLAPGDVSRPDDCERIAAEAIAALGGLDLVVISVGVARLGKIVDSTAEDWNAVLGTNVVGINQMIRAVVPRLASDGMVAALSSDTVGQPRSALAPYIASKAALEESLRAWRTEQPGLRFACFAIGPTAPTEFGAGFDPEVLATVYADWTRHGLVQEELMATDDVAGFLVGALAVALRYPGIGLEQLKINSPSAVVGARTAAEA